MAPTTRATSTAGDRRSGDRGFALYELILALAILGLVAGIVYPRVARAPGATELAIEAQKVAALLRTDRNAALRGGKEVVSSIDLDRGLVISGARGYAVRVPPGVRIELVQSDREKTDAGGGIRFLPDGGSSGGAISLSRRGIIYQVSVNWLTGGVVVGRRPAVSG